MKNRLAKTIGACSWIRFLSDITYHSRKPRARQFNNHSLFVHNLIQPRITQAKRNRLEINRLRTRLVPLKVLPAVVCVVVELADLKCSMEAMQGETMLHDIAIA